MSCIRVNNFYESPAVHGGVGALADALDNVVGSVLGVGDLVIGLHVSYKPTGRDQVWSATYACSIY